MQVCFLLSLLTRMGVVAVGASKQAGDHYRLIQSRAADLVVGWYPEKQRFEKSTRERRREHSFEASDSVCRWVALTFGQSGASGIHAIPVPGFRKSLDAWYIGSFEPPADSSTPVAKICWRKFGGRGFFASFRFR